ncbi:hypothetical protein ACWEPC_33510 [Nonomuraea sp. NPDC004297]
MVAVAALAGLGVYFWRVGLDDADKLASVIGVFVILAGLATAVHGLVTGRDKPREGEPVVSATLPNPATPDGGRSSIASPGESPINVQMRAETYGQSRVYQAGRDQEIDEG